MGRTIKPVALAGLAALLGTNNVLARRPRGAARQQQRAARHQQRLNAQSSLDVDNPRAVVLDRTFTLEWESVGENKFDVMLYPNSGSCDGNDPVDLCNKSDGCADSKGDLNVVVPVSVGSGEREHILLCLVFWHVQYMPCFRCCGL